MNESFKNDPSLLSITFVSVGLYTQYHDIKNPDISLDWNQVLGSIAGFKFCTHLNDTDAHLEEDSPHMVEHADKITPNVSMSTSHVSVLVPLVLMGEFPADSFITTTMLASQLGVKGTGGKTSVNISFYLHADVTSNQTLGGTQTGASQTCLQLTALTHVLPQTPSPPECPLMYVDETTSPVRAVAMETYKHDSQHCFSLKFTADPQLTVVLTQEEKAVCRYHLLLVSISLLVICVLMSLCGAFSSSKSHSYQVNDLQKELLLSP